MHHHDIRSRLPYFFLWGRDPLIRLNFYLNVVVVNQARPVSSSVMTFAWIFHHRWLFQVVAGKRLHDFPSDVWWSDEEQTLMQRSIFWGQSVMPLRSQLLLQVLWQQTISLIFWTWRSTTGRRSSSAYWRPLLT